MPFEYIDPGWFAPYFFGQKSETKGEGGWYITKDVKPGNSGDQGKSSLKNPAKLHHPGDVRQIM